MTQGEGKLFESLGWRIVDYHKERNDAKELAKPNKRPKL
jgi:hypothetical protein